MLKIYRASAGSGKTFALTRDYIHLLFQAYPKVMHRHIMAVTFTNKATEEMKSRIMDELYALSVAEKSPYRETLISSFNLTEDQVNQRGKEILTHILHDFSSFSIYTIDTFFQRVLRSFAREIGVYGAYNLELDTDSVLEQAVDNLFVDLDESNPLFGWMESMLDETISESKSYDVRKKMVQVGKELFNEKFQSNASIINQNISDKGFLLQYKTELYRIKNEFENHLADLAKRAWKMIEDAGLGLDDFSYKSSSGMNVLLKLIKKNGYELGNRFIQNANDVTTCYTKSSNKDTIDTINSVYQAGVGDLMKEILKYRNAEIVNYSTAKNILRNLNHLGVFVDLLIEIKKLTADKGVMLISDANMLLKNIIDENDTPFIFEKTGIFTDHYMIDEFQDTSAIQWENFRPLISNSLAQGNSNLVVGDVKQSIYRWRNSDWEVLDNKIFKEFREDQLSEIMLDTNWRSDKNIVEFNNTLFRKISHLLQQKLNDNLDDSACDKTLLEPLRTKITDAYQHVAQKVSPNAGEGVVKVKFVEQTDEVKWRTKSMAMLPKIIEEIQLRGYLPSDIALLTRTRNDTKLIVETLLRYKNSADALPLVSYEIQTAEGLSLESSAAVRFIIALLSIVHDNDDMIAREIVKNEYCEANGINIADTTVRPPADELFCPFFTSQQNEQLISLSNKSVFEMTEQIIRLFHLGNWAGQVAFIQCLQDEIYRFSKSHSSDVYSFLKWWEIKKDKLSVAIPESRNAMKVMTIHKSKGLDFKIVILPFCDWAVESNGYGKSNYLWCRPTQTPFNKIQLIPVEYGKGLKDTIFSTEYFHEQMLQFMDCINVAYVAFTRAKHELICVTPLPKDTKSNGESNSNLSKLLLNCITTIYGKNEGDEVDLSQYYDSEAHEMTMGIGDRIVQDVEPQKQTEGIQKIAHYQTSDSKARLNIKLQSLDYWLDNQELESSKLNYGLIMHDVLSGIKTIEDQSTAIHQMIDSGRITQQEATLVEDQLSAFWKNEEVKQWFAPNLHVLNETTILSPSGFHHRPDRVVIDGNKATIIDYKFGENENPKYRKQVQGYMQLIANMGYEVEGYLCYLTLNKIEKVIGKSE